ncbi:275_t:CDS:1, partial [Racocetra fulgida]
DASTISGRRLGTAYEQELEEKLNSALSSKAELRDLNGRLVAKFLLLQSALQKLEKEKSFDYTYDYINQLNDVNTKLRSRITSERTLAQEALFSNKITILSLKSKISQLEFKLVHFIPHPSFFDSDTEITDEQEDSNTITEITDEQEDSKLPDW